jgi:threonine dehydrogenase-like Zn-dependent dehydrogenase
VAVWVCGPVVQMTIKSAWPLGAGRVIAIDSVPERLRMAELQGKAETIDFHQVEIWR